MGYGRSPACALLALLVPVSLSALSVAMPPQTSGPTVEHVLQLAGEYVVDYGTRMSVVIGTERYTQFADQVAGSTVLSSKRILVSEYALVRSGDRWNGFRDVYDVDGRAVRDRKDRLDSLFRSGSATASTLARQIADESARYNIGSIVRNFNTPTMALYFLEPEVQLRFRFRKAGEERISGIPVWKIGYEEQRRPTIIVTPAGKDMPVTGTFWIDPVNGAVLKSQMMLRAETRVASTDALMNRASPRAGNSRPSDWKGEVVESSASVTVTYAHDERLALLVPNEMRETYQAPWAVRTDMAQGIAKINCVATYADFRRFETGARIVVPK